MGSQTSLNPYAAFIDSHDPVELIAATSSQLAKHLDAIGPEGGTVAPAPGKWSARDILCHLADTEIVFGFRLRQALALDHHVIQPFDQDVWARSYEFFDAGAAVAVFTAMRSWNLTLIRAMTPADRARPLTHPERGSMTVQTVIETMAGHDANHLRQLAALANRSNAQASR